jgi:hypothetical protein
MSYPSTRRPAELGDMRRLGVQNLVAFCLSDACRHQALIDVSKYPDDEVRDLLKSACRHVLRAAMVVESRRGGACFVRSGTDCAHAE